MKLGWIAPHLGCFGSIREIVELSNSMVRRGHSVTIHHPDGTPCRWLLYEGNVATREALADAEEYDLLLLVTNWKPAEYQMLLDARARMRGVVLMGYTPSQEIADTLRHWPHQPQQGLTVLAEAVHNPEVRVFADGPWQLDWMRREAGVQVAIPLGGINTRMFRPPVKRQRAVVVGASGDPRSRKGTDTVREAVALARRRHRNLELHTYWQQGGGQERLVTWYQECTIFLDGHRRGGWCNPVFEAMACGCAVVCTDIGAVRPLARHGETALVVPVDDAEAMANVLVWLLGSVRRIERLGAAAAAEARLYDYDIVAERLERYMERELA